jgi:hypothetical protein
MAARAVDLRHAGPIGGHGTLYSTVAARGRHPKGALRFAWVKASETCASPRDNHNLVAMLRKVRA